MTRQRIADFYRHEDDPAVALFREERAKWSPKHAAKMAALQARVEEREARDAASRQAASRKRGQAAGRVKRYGGTT